MNRSIRGRAFISLVDQGVSSISNVIGPLVVARVAGRERLGGYAVALTGWVLLQGVNNSLVTTPLIVRRRTFAAARQMIPLASSSGVLVGVAGGVLMAVSGLIATLRGSTSVGHALLAMAPWAVFLVLQDFWRWICIFAGRPDRALVNDGTYLVVQVALIVTGWLTGYRTASFVISAWGVGAFVGAAVGFIQFKTSPQLKGACAGLRESWAQGRWLLAEVCTVFLFTQASTYVTLAVLGAASVGALQAAQTLMGPATVIVLAGQMFSLTESAAQFRDGDWTRLRRAARNTSLGVGALVGAYGLVVAGAGQVILTTVYGPSFARFHLLLALMAIHYVVGSMAQGPTAALKASGTLRSLVIARICVALGSLVVLTATSRAWGLVGVGWGSVTTALVYLLVLWIVFFRVSRVGLRRESGAGGQAGEVVPSEVGVVPIRSQSE